MFIGAVKMMFTPQSFRLLAKKLRARHTYFNLASAIVDLGLAKSSLKTYRNVDEKR